MAPMFATAAYAVSGIGTLATVALRLLGADATLSFAVSAITILGLAYTLGHATEQLGIAAGPRIGGIMNATVGNIGEIIIAAFLIVDDKIEIVHASITGSIVGNLLLVLGFSLLVGGISNGMQSLRRGGGRHERGVADPGDHRPHRAGHVRIPHRRRRRDRPGRSGVLPDRGGDRRRRHPAAHHLRRPGVVLPPRAGGADLVAR